MTAEERERWFNDDSDISTDQVNEGNITFLLIPPARPALHSINHLTITEQSIKNGWVKLEQCYKHLDPVPEIDIVYNYKYMKDLTITSKSNIASALVKDQTVQLTDVIKNAEICISADVRILNKHSNNNFSLATGPYHLKFLDGYYPYHLTLNINYPPTLLKHIETSPGSQTGFMINKSSNNIRIDSYFEGMLFIEFTFQQEP